MNKLNFDNKELKKKYASLISNEHYIDAIMEQIMDNYGEVTVLDILDDGNIFQLVVKADDDIITMKPNYVSYTTTLACPNWDYTITYSNVLRKYYIPFGKEYRKNDKIVLKVFQDEVNPHKFKYTDYGTDNYQEYEISLRKDNNDNINDELIIKTLLSKEIKITRIRDLLVLFSRLTDLNTCELKIQDTYNMDSTIIVSYGMLSKYVECLNDEENNCGIKIYLENGKFYRDTTKSEELKEDIVPFVKKRGERNG